MKNFLLLASFIVFFSNFTNAQSCSPQGNQTSYGTNNVWIGYVYDNTNFSTYKGYVNEGTSTSPNFDEGFGGSNTYYATNGCSVQTETFSVRYKLKKTFANGTYSFTVGGDDGYRLSLDGGSTWIINKWFDQSYATTNYTVSLNGTYNMVLEFYENGGDNRISFNVSTIGSENTNTYGTNNIWRAYMYDGTNFNSYVGMITEGTSHSPSFSENFGGSNTYFATSGASIQTETFSVRFRLTKTFAAGSYTFFVGGDDGYRLSLDGGNTWIINKWNDQSYNVSNITITLTAGTYNMVLEYYENGGDNIVSFSYQSGNALAINLISFTGKETNNTTQLNWSVSVNSDPDHFDAERSVDGSNFTKINSVAGNIGKNSGASVDFSFTDVTPLPGKSVYRLKMTDINGVVTYSNLVFINRNSVNSNEIKIFPTVITNNTVNINTSSVLNDVTVYLTDFTGKTLSSQKYGKLSAGQTISFSVDAAHNTRGIYLIHITDNGNPAGTQKVIIQ
jgi:PA14 domain